MNRERTLIAGVCAILFVIFAFTPVIPLLLDTYEIDNTFADRAAVGLATLLCSIGFAWSVFSNPEKRAQKKQMEGKTHIKMYLIFIGIALIAIAWFTNIPLWLSEMTGLDTIFTYSNDTMEGGVGTRVMTSVFTGIGVLCFRFSTFKEKDSPFEPLAEYRYQKMMDDKE